MKNINWLVRIKNKTWWMVVIPTVLLLVNQCLELFGIHLDFTWISSQLMKIAETAFVLLALIGVVIDPTTEGTNDSKLAMTYKEPKKGE